MEDIEYWALQVWSTYKRAEFWDIAFFERRPTDKKGVASFVDATPRLMWMKGKAVIDIIRHLDSKKDDGVRFSFTQENERLLSDLVGSSQR